MSPAIRSGDLLFVTGMTGSLPDGTMPNEPEQQFTKAFDKIAEVLRAAGLDFGHVVDMTSYHVGIRTHFDCFASVRNRYVVEPYPAWTAVGVAELRRSGALVEVKVTARFAD
ncbi:RidA family protein [Marivita hallyeonensis]|nr:RidA family protein [Marivita hallyeonensis]